MLDYIFNVIKLSIIFITNSSLVVLCITNHIIDRIIHILKDSVLWFFGRTFDIESYQNGTNYHKYDNLDECRDLLICAGTKKMPNKGEPDIMSERWVDRCGSTISRVEKKMIEMEKHILKITKIEFKELEHVDKKLECIDKKLEKLDEMDKLMIHLDEKIIDLEQVILRKERSIIEREKIIIEKDNEIIKLINIVISLCNQLINLEKQDTQQIMNELMKIFRTISNIGPTIINNAGDDLDPRILAIVEALSVAVSNVSNRVVDVDRGVKYIEKKMGPFSDILALLSTLPSLEGVVQPSNTETTTEPQTPVNNDQNSRLISYDQTSASHPITMTQPMVNITQDKPVRVSKPVVIKRATQN